MSGPNNSRATRHMLGLSPDAPIPISRAARRLRSLVRSAVVQQVWLSGEVVDLRRDATGTVRFAMTHDGCRISCVVWSHAAAQFAATIKNGTRLVALGQLDVYERDARLSAMITAVRADGEGEVKQRLDQLRRRLGREGLFDPRRKRAVPAYPCGVVVITSEGSAALRDILAVARRRHPGIPITLVPATVQGPSAASSIVDALGVAQRLTTFDVVIVTRGGGSPAELAIYNDETLVRAIAASRLPVVTAIGHETDHLLADDVADLRVGTPSMAAERTIPDRRHLAQHLSRCVERANAALERRVRRVTLRLGHARTALLHVAMATFSRHRSHLTRVHEELSRHVSGRLRRSAFELIGFRAELDTRVRVRLEAERAHLGELTATLLALDPTAVLERGYAIVSSANGRVVSSVGEAERERVLRVRLRDGEIIVRVAAADQHFA